MKTLFALCGLALASACAEGTAEVAESGPARDPAPKPAAPAAATPVHLAALPASTVTAPPPLLQAMGAELERSMSELGTRGPQKPYFLSYEVLDHQFAAVSAGLGALVNSSADRSRSLEVDLRVGDRRLDNTHQTRTDDFITASFFHGGQPFPLDPDPAATRAAIWLDTDRDYKEAVRRLDAIRANRAVKAEEEDRADDFSEEKPQHFLEEPRPLEVDRTAWEARARKLSGFFRDQPEILHSQVELQGDVRTEYFASSEGGVICQSVPHYRLSVWATARAEDGEDLHRYEAFDAASLDHLPDDARVLTAMQQVSADLLALRKAPVMDPFTGPAILQGRAAGVFFHEALGHRLEGHRQKRDIEGQTFAKKRGEKVMSELIDVFDDPRLDRTDRADLNGHYFFDDEGVPSQRASLIERGVLMTFLMSRSPTHGVNLSNGHGRRQAGRPLVARQGNLVVSPRATVPAAELRQLLKEEATRQGKPFGLLFRELDGGFTDTMRFGFQGFKVLPVMVYRVYVDGRPDQLVRGTDIVGTPLATLNEIVAAGDDYDTFNGYCGAESGFVPVSATSPSLLVKKIEVARKFKGDERPPVLPPPPRPDPGGAR